MAFGERCKYREKIKRKMRVGEADAPTGRWRKENVMEKLSTRALIEVAKRCAIAVSQNTCEECAFRCEGECDCTGALLIALVDKLEELDTRWIDCKLALPKEEDEYLVMIAGATKPTVLYYDVEEEGFYGEDDELNQEWYPVTHWAMMPNGPAGTPIPTKEVVRRCATCAYEDKLGDEERCIECEKHNLWEEKK